MHLLEQLAFPTRVAKRAQYEAFEFEVHPRGVQVRNCSHDEPSNHEYLITVHDGVPTACTCPADERFEGACKHRVAVAIRRPVISAAVAQQVHTDGGAIQTDEPSPPNTDDQAPAECECNSLIDSFPCWWCVRTGRKSMPDYVR